MKTNTQDKLLSDEELRDALYDLSIQNLQDDETGEGFYAMSPEAVIDLINTQKRLYAESVIGEDEDNPAPKEPWGATYRNELRAEQRARIK